MIYAVIDTNVVVSAYLTHNLNSATSKVVEALFRGRICPLYNEEIMAEYEEVLSRPHFDISDNERQSLFNYIRLMVWRLNGRHLMNCSRMRMIGFSMRLH